MSPSGCLSLITIPLYVADTASLVDIAHPPLQYEPIRFDPNHTRTGTDAMRNPASSSSPLLPTPAPLPTTPHLLRQSPAQPSFCLPHHPPTPEPSAYSSIYVSACTTISLPSAGGISLLLFFLLVRLWKGFFLWWRILLRRLSVQVRRRSRSLSIAQMECMTSLTSDMFYDILRRLDGPTLARAACACADFCSISKDEKLWENVCESLWPSTGRKDVGSLISSIGGFRKFYADCFPLIVNKDIPAIQWDTSLQYSEEWVEDDYYDDANEFGSVSPSDFVIIVDVKYKGRSIYSKVLWGIPGSDDSCGWFYNCPFRVDLLSYSDGDDDMEGEVILSVADGLPPIMSIERERKDAKLWRELHDDIKLSWIIVNKKEKQAANLASWSPLGGQRHWPTDKDFLLRFGSILPAKDILPCQVVECILIMKFRIVHLGVIETDQTALKLTELSMQLEDMGGAHVNGRNSLLVLRESLTCHRSRNYSELLESCHLYLKAQSQLEEEKIRSESRTDRLCMVSAILAFVTLFYCML